MLNDLRGKKLSADERIILHRRRIRREEPAYKLIERLTTEYSETELRVRIRHLKSIRRIVEQKLIALQDDAFRVKFRRLEFCVGQLNMMKSKSQKKQRGYAKAISEVRSEIKDSISILFAEGKKLGIDFNIFLRE